jgi:hypothetical protein
MTFLGQNGPQEVILLGKQGILFYIGVRDTGTDSLDNLIVIGDGISLANGADQLRATLSGDKHLPHVRETTTSK